MACEKKYKNRFIVATMPVGESQNEIELIFPSSKVKMYFEGKEFFSGDELKEAINKSVSYCFEYIPKKYEEERSGEICETLEQFVQERIGKIENKNYIIKRYIKNCSCRQEVTNFERA